MTIRPGGETLLGAHKRRESLGHAQLPGDVHIQLTRHFLRRQMQKRAGDGDPGIVDETGERLTFQILPHLLSG